MRRDLGRLIIAANYLPYTPLGTSNGSAGRHCRQLSQAERNYPLHFREPSNQASPALSLDGEEGFGEEGFIMGDRTGKRGLASRQHCPRGFPLDCLRANCDENSNLPSPDESFLGNFSFSSSCSEESDNHTSPTLDSNGGAGSSGRRGSTLPAQLRVQAFFGGNWGLYTAVRALGNNAKDRLWVGSLSSSAEPLSAAELPSIKDHLRDEYGCLLVDVAGGEQTMAEFLRFCKMVMWPIFHSMLPQDHLSCQMQSDWHSYVRVNETFVAAIAREYRDGDTIWINDYHLMLAPQLLRQRFPRATIGFFLHVPFPTSEIFRCLPMRQELLGGILASDLIGFQTYDYARHFIMSCTRILGLSCTPRGVHTDAREVAFGAFPIGIDASRIERRLDRPQVLDIRHQLRARYAGKHIVFSRDKMDPVKGIRQKLQGFSQFLEDYPVWRGRVILTQIALAGHAEYGVEMNELAAQVNAKFGTLEYSPVVLISQDVTFEHYLALASISDACLITSLRDGMNLTSHEYILCQRDNHGVVILSEFAGTCATFGSTMRVNPWDPMDIADVLNAALSMEPQERRMRSRDVYDKVQRNSGVTWARSFLEALQAEALSERERNALVAPLLDQRAFLHDYALGVGPGRRRLLLFDYDALIPSFKNILHSLERIRLVKACLTALSADRQNVLVLISERSPEQMEHTLEGLNQLILSADDGFSVRLPEEGCWRTTMAPPEATWWSRIQKILEYYAERTPGSWIEVKSAAYVWHFGQADPLFSRRQVKECQSHIQDAIGTHYPIHAVLLGYDRLQVRLRSVGKRQALGHLLQRIVGQGDIGFAGIFLRASKDDEGVFSLCRSFFAKVAQRESGSHSFGTIPIGLDPGAEEFPAIPFPQDAPQASTLAVPPPREGGGGTVPLYLCAIGSQIPSIAEYHIPEADELIRALSGMHGGGGTGGGPGGEVAEQGDTAKMGGKPTAAALLDAAAFIS